MLPNLVRIEAFRDDAPLVVQVNASLLGVEPRDAWPWHVAVVVEGKGPVDDVELGVMEDVAADLAGALLELAGVLLVARVTEPRRVQVLLRAHEVDEVKATLDAAEVERPWAFLVEHDPAWGYAAPALHLLAPND